MESPDISAIADDSEVTSGLVPSLDDNLKTVSQDSEELVGNSESLLAGFPISVPSQTVSQSIEESQSLLAEGGHNGLQSSDNEGMGNPPEISNESEMLVDKSDGDYVEERNNEIGMDEENEDLDRSEENSNRTIDGKENSEEAIGEEMDTEDEGDDDDDTENTLASIKLPFGRVKKLMKICVNTNEEDEVTEIQTSTVKSKRKSGKGSKQSKGGSGGSTANYLVTKEAIYLTAVATELFVSAVAQQASRIAMGAKKKNITVDHLKRALSSTESYEFLQGCFQPSILIGD